MIFVEQNILTYTNIDFLQQFLLLNNVLYLHGHLPALYPERQVLFCIHLTECGKYIMICCCNSSLYQLLIIKLNIICMYMTQ